MSSRYKFDFTTTPASMYEWDDGVWAPDRLKLNESLVQNNDQTVSLIKDYGTFTKEVVFSLDLSTTDISDDYEEIDEIFHDASGGVIDDPTETEDDDVEDDQDQDGSNNDYLNGSADDDIKHGGAGDDVVDGAEGDDYLFGEEGDDTLDGGNGKDILAGGIGFDNLIGGSGDDNLDGNEDDDILEGDEGDDDLDGGSGDDDLVGGQGNDVLNGGAGVDTADYSDVLSAVVVDLNKGTAKGDGKDTLLDIENAIGGSGNDKLIANNQTGSELDGGAGADTLTGGTAADVLYGGDGNDNVNAGAGDDLIIGGNGAGDDKYNGGKGIDTVKYTSATAGITVNLQKGTATSSSTDAGIGKDKLTSIENIIGGNYGDNLTGSTAENTINGEDGDDYIYGGLGKDNLTGGTGNDYFIFKSIKESGLGLKSDVITDFTSGDKIDLSAIDAKSGYTKNDTFSFLTEAPTLENANGALWFDDGILYGSTDKDTAAEFQVELTGVSTLDANAFIL